MDLNLKEYHQASALLQSFRQINGRVQLSQDHQDIAMIIDTTYLLFPRSAALAALAFPKAAFLSSIFTIIPDTHYKPSNYAATRPSSHVSYALSGNVFLFHLPDMQIFEPRRIHVRTLYLSFKPINRPWTPSQLHVYGTPDSMKG